MKRLVALPQGSGNGIELDVEGTSIEWSMRAEDMSKPSRRRAAYSLNFRLPFTANNNRFFNHWYEVNIVENTWSHRTKTEVIVYDDLDELFVGSLQLMAVNTFTSTYECVILGESASLFTELRGKTWRDLFTGGAATSTILDHVVNIDNVMDSWDTSNDITAGAGAGTIVYIIADNAEFESVDGNTFMSLLYAQGLASDAGTLRPLRAKHCRPTIRVKWLLDYIFASTGFTYESQFAASAEFDKLYMTLGTEQEELPLRSLYTMAVGLQSDLPVNGGEWQNVPLVADTGDYYDPDNLMQGGQFVAPSSGTYTLALVVLWETSSANSSENLYTSARAFVDGTNFAGAAINYTTSSATTALVQYNFTLTMAAGDLVPFQVKHNINPSSTDPWYVSASGTYITLVSYDTNTALLDVPSAFPDITLDEWLRAIVAEFNLAVVAHPAIRKHVIIEPMEDYLADYGQVRDWTQKIDIDKDIVLRPTTEEQPKRVTFTDASGKDFKNSWWQNRWGWTKGRKYWDNDNEFAVREEEVGGVFAPFRLSPLPQGYLPWHTATTYPNFLILRLWSKREGDVRSDTTPPMLAFYHGTKPLDDVTIRREGDGLPLTEYPFFSHLSDSPATDDSLNLRWGYDYPDHQDSPYVGFSGRFKYREFYARHLERLYGQDARILECSAWLTASDVKSVSFADKIWVKDAYYRVYELNNYAVGEHRPVRLKLLKVNETTSYQCDAYPYAWATNGEVLFADAETGNPVTATAACCLAADFTWDEDSGTCLWNADNGGQGGTGGGEPDSPTGTTNDGNPSVPIAPNGYEVETNDPTTGIVGTTAQFGVYGQTSSTGNVPLSTAFGQSSFTLPNDAVVAIEVQATAYQYGGTGGTIGSNSSVNQQFLVQANNGQLRVVSSSTINSEGVSRSLNLSLTTDGLPAVQVEAVGANNEDLYWYAQVNVVGMVVPATYVAPTPDNNPAIYNGEASDLHIAFNNSNAELIFNG